MSSPSPQEGVASLGEGRGEIAGSKTAVLYSMTTIETDLPSSRNRPYMAICHCECERGRA